MKSVLYNLFFAVNLVNSFTTKPVQISQKYATKSLTSRFVVDEAFPMMDAPSIEDIKSARAAFALCFFGAAGSASLGREVIPKTWGQWERTNALKGTGAEGSGGEEMDLFGYPEPVYTADVVKVLNNKMKPSEIEKYYCSECQRLRDKVGVGGNS